MNAKSNMLLQGVEKEALQSQMAFCTLKILRNNNTSFVCEPAGQISKKKNHLNRTRNAKLAIIKIKWGLLY